ncbi:hypothetical protein ElyMa_004279600 [Elysia marginata]|uniref:FLYWCH-type domain-containing protein n=1 Tax=Elysia marginata TaxID=1093978 RepID=A0AAV4GWI3_9GAST|nr:hypothetical protein ElyMa_004279600 [Elysia marginata]
MELFVMERGNKGLRFNNYTYRLVEVNKKSKRFWCTKKDCPASLLTDCNEQNIVKIGKPHNHEAPSTHAKERISSQCTEKKKSIKKSFFEEYHSSLYHQKCEQLFYQDIILSFITFLISAMCNQE